MHMIRYADLVLHALECINIIVLTACTSFCITVCPFMSAYLFKMYTYVCVRACVCVRMCVCEFVCV